jgi:NitT/TauT family transport system permease protein
VSTALTSAHQRSRPARVVEQIRNSDARYTIGSLLVGGVIWETIGQISQFPFFPPLSAILARLIEMIGAGLIVDPLINSLTNLAIGFSFSVVVGVTVGVLMGAFWKVDASLDIYVYALLTAPSLVFAPILFSIFGLGRGAIVGVIVLYSLFIIMLNTAAAVRSVPASLIEMGRAFQASNRSLLLRIVLPSAAPLIMSGIRLGAGRAVKGMINGEMFIAVVGLGAVVIHAGKVFDSETVLAVLIAIIVVAFILVWLVQWVDGRVTAWLPETQRRARGH